MTIETPLDGIAALQDFLIDRTAPLSADIRNQLRELCSPTYSQGPVAGSAMAAELIYAKRDEVPPELLEIGAQLATMLAGFNMHGMGQDSRGYAIAATIRKMPAVASKVPSAASLAPPELHADFAPAPEPEAPMPAPSEPQEASEPNT